MPKRVIREGILTSDAVNSLDFPAEVFFRRLMNKADDLGIYDARPRVLLCELYALKQDVTEADVSCWLTACEKVGIIRTYEANGKPYLFIPNFGQELRFKSTPKFPLPPWMTLERTEKGKLIAKLSDDETQMGPTRDPDETQMRDEEKRREEKRSEANSTNKVVASSTLYPEAAHAAPAAPQPPATTTTLPEGFSEWLHSLKQSHPSARKSKQLAADVQAAALAAYERCPDAGEYADLLTAYLSDGLQEDRYRHAFYRPTGQAQFFAQLEDTICHAERWDKETKWSKRNKKAHRKPQEPRGGAFSDRVAQVATEEDKAAFSASMDKILGRRKIHHG